jgi:hypothetical protein
MRPAIPSSPVAMSANDAGSGFDAMLLAAAAAPADDPEPSEPSAALLDGPPLTSSATGFASSLKALPAGGAASVPVSFAVPDGGDEMFDGALGFGELGPFGPVDRADTDVATRALVSVPV